jgi:hypothetical protein
MMTMTAKLTSMRTMTGLMLRKTSWTKIVTRKKKRILMLPTKTMTTGSM